MTEAANEIMTNREFVAMVRAKLDAAGHRDIAIDRQWIDEGTSGVPFLLNVPVGPELIIALKPREGFLNQPASGADWYVGHFAEALVRLRAAEKTLCDYVRKVHRAARREIAAARDEGLDVSLETVGLAPILAYALTGGTWKDAAKQVLATITVRHTSFHLRPAVTEIVVEEPEDVARELEDLLTEQREHQDQLAALDELGADLEVDALTLDILAAHELDAEELLREAWLKQRVSADIRFDGCQGSLSLSTSNGVASATLLLPEFVWNGTHLWFRDEPESACHDDLIGKILGARLPHPAFTRRLVVGTQSNGRELELDRSGRLLFDADTSRIWRPDAPLAAAA